jgi:hypothetical protein
MALPKLNTVTYKAKIPSTGKSVEYKPFTVKEQKMLLLAKESEDKGQMIRAARDLIKSCTLGKVDVSKLTMYDFEYLFIKARSKSVGETSDVLIKCSKCGHQNEVSLNLDDCTVTETTKSLKVKLDDSIGVVLKFPSLTDAEKLSEDGSNDEISTIAACIDSIYTNDEIFAAEDHTPTELVDFIESLSAKQLKLVSEVLQDMPKVTLEHEFKCMKCGEHNKLKIEGLKNFF